MAARNPTSPAYGAEGLSGCASINGRGDRSTSGLSPTPGQAALDLGRGIRSRTGRHTSSSGWRSRSDPPALLGARGTASSGTSCSASSRSRSSWRASWRTAPARGIAAAAPPNDLAPFLRTRRVGLPCARPLAAARRKSSATNPACALAFGTTISRSAPQRATRREIARSRAGLARRRHNLARLCAQTGACGRASGGGFPVLARPERGLWRQETAPRPPAALRRRGAP
jgi:hypothetical protein